jgi:hypothetical protein
MMAPIAPVALIGSVRLSCFSAAAEIASSSAT